MLEQPRDAELEIRGALSKARRLAARSKNNVLIFLIEAALIELDDSGLEPAEDDTAEVSARAQ